MKAIVLETNFPTFFEHGWGNGYVIIPKGHKLHGIPYTDIDVEIHGGLTYGEVLDEEMIKNNPEIDMKYLGDYMVGFDTCHYKDNLTDWPKERVEAEAELLKERLLKL